MRIRIPFILLLTMITAFIAGEAARAQSSGAAQDGSRAELAVDYNFVHSNAPPGDCGCFNLNGGGVTFAWRLDPSRFALVGDISITHAGGSSSNGYDLTLSTFTGGVRYSPHVGKGPVQPFGQMLIGLAHSSGSLVQAPNPASSNAGAAFAALVGGGLDLRASPHVSIRLVQADYLVTTFDNGVNDHQNNLRISAGFVFHF